MSAGNLIALIVLGISELICLGACIWLVKPAYRQLMLVWASRGWPTTQGVVASTTIREQEHSTETNDGRTTNYTYYCPVVEFRYLVGNAEFASEQRVFGDLPAYPDREKAIAILKKYPLRGTVQVHYDPVVPSNGVLEPRYLGSVLRGLGGGLLLFAVAWFIFQFALGVLGLN